MDIMPLGERSLVKLEKPKTVAGIELPPGSQAILGVRKGVVVKGAMQGSNVLFRLWSYGQVIEDNDEEFVLLNDFDIEATYV